MKSKLMEEFEWMEDEEEKRQVCTKKVSNWEERNTRKKDEKKRSRKHDVRDSRCDW